MPCSIVPSKYPEAPVKDATSSPDFAHAPVLADGVGVADGVAEGDAPVEMLLEGDVVALPVGVVDGDILAEAEPE